MTIRCPSLHRPGSADHVPFRGTFDVQFIRHGNRTSIGRQFVSYPFHLTRPFALDPAIPELITVYQQSSSGGLYRAEQLDSRYHVGRRAAAHVTTQAATIVHDCQGQPASQTIDVIVEEGAFLALTPDPLVLFPGASYVSRLTATMEPRSVLLLADAFSQHDPKATSHPFDTYVSGVEVYEGDGRMLVRDVQRITGRALGATCSPIGRWSVVSSFMLLGDLERLPTKAALQGCPSGIRDAVVGISELPNRAGWGVRCLAQDAVAARGIADQLFSLGVYAALGGLPVPRRK